MVIVVLPVCSWIFHSAKRSTKKMIQIWSLGDVVAVGWSRCKSGSNEAKHLPFRLVSNWPLITRSDPEPLALLGLACSFVCKLECFRQARRSMVKLSWLYSTRFPLVATWDPILPLGLLYDPWNLNRIRISTTHTHTHTQTQEVIVSQRQNKRQRASLTQNRTGSCF